MNREDIILIDLFCLHHGIEISFISTLEDYGLIKIIVIEEKEYFLAEQLATVEKIIRLYHDLNINLEGIDAIINLLHQVDDIKSQLTIAQNRIAFFEK